MSVCDTKFYKVV